MKWYIRSTELRGEMNFPASNGCDSAPEIQNYLQSDALEKETKN